MDISTLLEELKDSPYKTVPVCSPHTGIVENVVRETGRKVRKGELMAYIERERNKKQILAPTGGSVEKVNPEVDGAFVEEGVELFSIRHYLTKDEAIDVILKEALQLYTAPEQARYYFVPEVEKKISSAGAKSVHLRPGMELFIMSRMKREKTLYYQGPEGIIFAVYFQNGESVEQGRPLIGICPEDRLSQIQDVVDRVHGEWEEPK
jgi:biotin carboxyl carrier protein